jgi:hypothetical protein
VSLDLSTALPDSGPSRATVAGRHLARGGLATPLAGALWVLVAVLWLGTAVRMVPSLLPLVLFAAAFATFTLPGWPLARWLVGWHVGWLFVAPLALVLGYAAGVTIFLLLRLFGAASPLIVAAACVAVTTVLAMCLPSAEDAFLEVPALDRSDGAALAALLIVVGAVVAPVFVHVGLPTPSGLAYRAYFIADLFAHMSVTAELAKGLTPPLNPYFPTEPLPYYWSFFSFPSLFAGLQPALAVDRGILLTDLTLAGAYGATWYLILRTAGFSPWASAAAWILVVLASSFEGSYFLFEPNRRGPWTDFRYLNVDAITRWRWDLPPVDGMHRLFWYTPQHGLAITLGTLSLLVAGSARAAARPGRGLVEGWLLAVALACSSFNGLLLVAAYALAETSRLVAGRLRGAAPWLAGRALAASVVLAGLALMFAIGIIQRDAGEVILRWNPHFLRGPWAFLALTFGAPLVLAPFGARTLWARSPRFAWGLAALAGVSTTVFLYVDVRGHENTYVSFRTGQFLFVVLAAGTAAAIDAARAWPRTLRLGFATLAVLATLAALPTVALDTYNAQDITNVERSVGGFPWTVHVTPAHQAAAAWTRTHLSSRAVLQMDPKAHGRATWALLPAFAERRIGVGLALFEPNPRRFDRPMADVGRIFSAGDTATAFAICERFAITDLWVGPEERAAYGDAAADKFLGDPAHFVPLYAADAVAIYRVRLPIVPAGGHR